MNYPAQALLETGALLRNLHSVSAMFRERALREAGRLNVDMPCNQRPCDLIEFSSQALQVFYSRPDEYCIVTFESKDLFKEHMHALVETVRFDLSIRRLAFRNL